MKTDFIMGLSIGKKKKKLHINECEILELDMTKRVQNINSFTKI